MEQCVGNQWRTLLKRRDLITIVGAVIVAWPPCARAQTPRKRPLIGVLASGRQDAYAPFISAFLEGMRDHGYVEGQNFDLALLSADADYARLAAGAKELVSLDPDVIVAVDPIAMVALKKATSKIAVVGSILNQPVELGMIESYAHPGGNVTGILNEVKGLRAKTVEIARDLVPNARMIGILFNPSNPVHPPVLQEIEAAARTKGMKVTVGGAAASADIESAFKSLVAAGAQAVIVIGDAMFLSERARIAALAIAAHLPTISNAREFVDAGGLVSYGVDYIANQRRAAFFVDKILKGAKAADLPVEFPSKVEMVVNLKTASALGIVVPSSIMLSADDVIQ
jgi:putative tryptophan/tyrosine transport system substrate-binding protein